MMSTSPNPDASVFASIMELHFKELDLILEQLLLNKEQMLPILQKCFSLTFLKEGLAEQIAVHKRDSADRINPGPLDSALLKDCVAQVLVPSNKRFIKFVHCYLLEAGKEKQAEEYLQKVFNKVMEDMGLGENPSNFFMPPAAPEVFPTPAPGWRPGQAMADGNVP
ncbi:uncharacterized protein LOC109947573 isoform X2 [Prunus persica]|uniref:uncharacterized protein LOC109947573 isoform X2 n=1 Tax=Prunus persica TaxID=3760 RepID=UPI0009AB707C|nr:uncharacterized protein LOC109947573 isoform X2 [Prunus persica]